MFVWVNEDVRNAILFQDIFDIQPADFLAPS
jgi:hypothetical protein